MQNGEEKMEHIKMERQERGLEIEKQSERMMSDMKKCSNVGYCHMRKQGGMKKRGKKDRWKVMLNEK